MNEVSKQAVTEGFSSFINKNEIQRKIAESLPMNRQSFMTSIVSAVSNNPALAECDHMTILTAFLQGESLGLTPSAQLGYYYIVPFNDRRNGRKVAQFQLSYKGYIQLAIRSAQYKKLNVLEIKEGELDFYNPISEELSVRFIEDDQERERVKTIGYYAMFELHNGFTKAIYWSARKMESHAVQYSMGYKAKRGYTFWEKDFDGMAKKTMLRQLLSKWGVMSTDIQKAMVTDMGMINEDGTVRYIDNEEEVVEVSRNEPPRVAPAKPVFARPAKTLDEIIAETPVTIEQIEAMMRSRGKLGEGETIKSRGLEESIIKNINGVVNATLEFINK